MKKTKGSNIFGIILIVALSWGNLLHLLWTIWLTVEQIRTGWGGGTGIEMLALMPWAIEWIFAPFLLAEIVYLVLSAYLPSVKGIKIANVCLFATILLQYGLFNLFLFY